MRAAIALAAAGWVKSEPLALLPLLALVPWTLCNYQLFGRFVTSPAPVGTHTALCWTC